VRCRLVGWTWRQPKSFGCSSLLGCILVSLRRIWSAIPFETAVEARTPVLGYGFRSCVGMTRRVGNRDWQLCTAALRRPKFIRIESGGVNEYDTATAAFVETGRVQRSVRPWHDNGAKIPASAHMASKGTLTHLPEECRIWYCMSIQWSVRNGIRSRGSSQPVPLLRWTRLSSSRMPRDMGSIMWSAEFGIGGPTSPRLLHSKLERKWRFSVYSR
jgi:hypothetical protein